MTGRRQRGWRGRPGASQPPESEPRPGQSGPGPADWAEAAVEAAVAGTG